MTTRCQAPHERQRRTPSTRSTRLQLAPAEAVPDLIPTPSAKIFFQMMNYRDPDSGEMGVDLDFFTRCPPSGGTLEHAVPAGLFGGEAPEPSTMHLGRADGAVVEVRPNTFFDIHAGDELLLHMMGGPGYGHPLDRDPDRVLADVRDGFTTPEKAYEVYGVVVSEGSDGLTVLEHEKTKQRRADLRETREHTGAPT